MRLRLAFVVLIALGTWSSAPAAETGTRVNNLGNTPTGIDNDGFAVAVALQFGTGDQSGELLSISLLLFDRTDGGSRFNASLYSDDGGRLGSRLFDFGDITTSGDGTHQLYTLDAPPGILLLANTSYWIAAGLDEHSVWSYTDDTSTVGPGSLGDHAWLHSHAEGGRWWSEQGFPYPMAVDLRSVPEPSALALMIIGVFGPLALSHRRVWSSGFLAR